MQYGGYVAGDLWTGEGAIDYFDTWEWNWGRWARKSTMGLPSSTEPLTYDVRYGRCLSYDSGLATWDGSTWAPSVVGPTPRRFPLLAHLPRNGRTVLFGGVDSTKACSGGTSQYCSDTWEWDGVQWTQVSTEGPFMKSYGYAVDAGRNVVVLFGGYPPDLSADRNSDTWEWNGATWTKVSDTGPSPRSVPSMGYDASRGKVVLVGGTDSTGSCTETGEWTCADTWEWDGATWTLAGDHGPMTGVGMRIAAHARHGRALMYGVGLDGMHLLEGSRSRPAVLNKTVVSAIDSEGAELNGLTVSAVAGGAGSHGQAFTVVPDALNWQEARDRCASLGPGARLAELSDAGLADVLRAELAYPVRSWLGLKRADAASSFAWESGQALADANWAAGQPASGNCAALLALASPTVDSSFRWASADCAERMPAICQLGAVDGATLRVWDGAVWRVVDANPDLPGAPGALQWTTTDPRDIQSFLMDRDQALYTAVTPLSENGWGGADTPFGQVSVDYFQVDVSYRLPVQP